MSAPTRTRRSGQLAAILLSMALALTVFGSPAAAQSSTDFFDPDPPVAGEPASITIGPITQTVSYQCVTFNRDGSCASYQICPSPTSVVYRITFRSPTTGETFSVTLDSEFTAADPYPSAPDGGTSGEFLLTGSVTFPEGGDWEYQSQITQNNACGSSQTSISLWAVVEVAEDATVPVVHPIGLVSLAAVAAPAIGVMTWRRRRLELP